MRFARCLLVVALSLSAACAAKQSPPATVPLPPAAFELSLPKELPPRQDLPPEAREMLTSLMLRHGDQMMVLMVAVVLLNYQAITLLADDLAEEPKLGRPAPGDTSTLNALLPPSFFEHQDELTNHARALASAARAADDRQLVEAFAAVTKTCVGCHAVYLHDDPEPFEHEEPEPLCDPGDACRTGPSQRGRGGTDL